MGLPKLMDSIKVVVTILIANADNVIVQHGSPHYGGPVPSDSHTCLALTNEARIPSFKVDFLCEGNAA